MVVIPKQRQREATAYHEAGHAVACYVFKHQIKKVSIIPGEGYQGKLHSSGLPEDLVERIVQRENLSPEEEKLLWEKTIISLAGPASECLFTGVYNWRGSMSDRSKANAFAAPLDLTGKDFDEQAKELMYSNWKKVEDVAQALLEKQTLTAQQVHEICENLIG
jgi:ATP-dependent Zn protease